MQFSDPPVQLPDCDFNRLPVIGRIEKPLRLVCPDHAQSFRNTCAPQIRGGKGVGFQLLRGNRSFRGKTVALQIFGGVIRMQL